MTQGVVRVWFTYLGKVWALPVWADLAWTFPSQAWSDMAQRSPAAEAAAILLGATATAVWPSFAWPQGLGKAADTLRSWSPRCYRALPDKARQWWSANGIENTLPDRESA